ncbi:hypothetical protein BD410DRAFT_826372 [Rickenella mellea]|uniref:SPT2-domain-containing protein n=1 Tax=Rickenella mellea TaxID=50990 RepID=A0A4Y7QDK6_9AGAM|nr:hypothetical protein BD410DRAFT_826372 [Rickenella mellea]
MAGTSRFAELMALSRSQTSESAAATETLLLERRRKEETKRKEQELRDRKERELQAKLLQKRFEEERLARERQEKAAEEERRREELIKKREEEHRHALLYGPKKAKQERPSRDDARPRKQREGSPDSDSAAMVLTREEKRQRRLRLEMNRSSSLKRSSHSNGTSKAPKMLRGGVIDSTESFSTHNSSSGGTQSVKARLASLPNTLTKLNVVKRDTRTIDEILQDREKARASKVLDGDEARDFHDWFSKPKKKDLNVTNTLSLHPSDSQPSSRAITPIPSGSQTKQSAPASRDSPAPIAKPRVRKSSTPPMASSQRTGSAPSASKTVIRKVNVDSFNTNASSKARSTPAAASFFSSRVGGSTAKDVTARASHSVATRPTPTIPRKRARSVSDSPPPPSAKKASSRNDFRNDIWKLFGKDRKTYVEVDVLSDDDDMEVDADALRREELRSARLARKEDEMALEEERRHEEEKRRRRKEKEMYEKRRG